MKWMMLITVLFNPVYLKYIFSMKLKTFYSVGGTRFLESRMCFTFNSLSQSKLATFQTK